MACLTVGSSLKKVTIKFCRIIDIQLYGSVGELSIDDHGSFNDKVIIHLFNNSKIGKLSCCAREYQILQENQATSCD